MLAMCIAEMTTCYVYFWQEYVSGTYKFFTFDCTEEQVLFIASFFTVGWFGPDILTTKVRFLMPYFIPMIHLRTKKMAAVRSGILFVFYLLSLRTFQISFYVISKILETFNSLSDVKILPSLKRKFLNLRKLC